MSRDARLNSRVMRFALLMTSVAAATALYSQSQAQSFLQMEADVLSAVAPNIYPVNKLAARVSLTFAAPTKGPLADADSALKSAMGNGVVYSVVSAHVVLFEQIYDKDGKYMAQAPEQVLVVPAMSPSLYNVTALPNPYVSVESAWALIGGADVHFVGCSDCNTTCGCSRNIGLRYVVDVFSNYDVSSSSVANYLAMRWPYMPNSTLQYTLPAVEVTPESLEPSAALFASSGVSLAVLAAGVVLWHKAAV